VFRECIDVYTAYSENRKFITVQEFQSFLVQEQQDPMGNDEREVSRFMRDYLQDSQRNVHEPFFTTIEVWTRNYSSDVCRLKFNISVYTSIALVVGMNVIKLFTNVQVMFIFVYLCNKNQLDTLFILSVFCQSTSTCFGHICGPKHVEVDWQNTLRINSASSWFLLHRCIEMQGQQKIKFGVE